MRSVPLAQCVDPTASCELVLFQQSDNRRHPGLTRSTHCANGVNRPTRTGPTDDFIGRLAFSPDTGTLAAPVDEYAQTPGGLPQTAGTAPRLAVLTARVEVIHLRRVHRSRRLSHRQRRGVGPILSSRRSAACLTTDRWPSTLAEPGSVHGTPPGPPGRARRHLPRRSCRRWGSFLFGLFPRFPRSIGHRQDALSAATCRQGTPGTPSARRTPTPTGRHHGSIDTRATVAPQCDEQPPSPYSRPRTRHAGSAPPSLPTRCSSPALGTAARPTQPANGDNESARRNRRPGHGCVVPVPVRSLELGIEPQGSRPDGERQPQEPTSPQVRGVGAPPSASGPQTREQRIQSVQAKLTIRQDKTNVSAGQSLAEVGRVGLEPTADGL